MSIRQFMAHYLWRLICFTWHRFACLGLHCLITLKVPWSASTAHVLTSACALSIAMNRVGRCSLNTYERKTLREFFTKVLKVSSLFWKLQKKTAFPKSFSPGWGNPPYDPLHLTSTVQLGLKIQELRWKHHQEATQMEERKFCQGPRI